MFHFHTPLAFEHLFPDWVALFVLTALFFFMNCSPFHLLHLENSPD
jgi:hypothetical protein